MPCAGARPLDHPFAAESHLRISNGEFLKLNSSECRPWTSPMQIWPIPSAEHQFFLNPYGT